MFTKDIKAEIEESNIRMSSNDDVLFAVDVIDRLIEIVDAFSTPMEDIETILGSPVAVATTVSAPLEHITDGTKCWCEPEVIDGLIVHRRTDN